MHMSISLFVAVQGDGAGVRGATCANENRTARAPGYSGNRKRHAPVIRRRGRGKSSCGPRPGRPSDLTHGTRAGKAWI
jgi:hypothetical protein